MVDFSVNLNYIFLVCNDLTKNEKTGFRAAQYAENAARVSLIVYRPPPKGMKCSKLYNKLKMQKITILSDMQKRCIKQMKTETDT